MSPKDWTARSRGLTERGGADGGAFWNRAANARRISALPVNLVAALAVGMNAVASSAKTAITPSRLDVTMAFTRDTATSVGPEGCWPACVTVATRSHAKVATPMRFIVDLMIE